MEAENVLLSRILQVTTNGGGAKKGSVFLKNLASDRNCADSDTPLTLANIDDILIERLSQSDCTTLQGQLLSLNNFIERIETELGRMGIPAASRDVLTKLLPVIHRYVATVVQCPELFDQSERSLTRSGEILLSMFMSTELSIVHVVRVFDTLVTEAGMTEATEVITPFVLSVMQKLISVRSFDISGDTAIGDVNTLAMLLKLSKASSGCISSIMTRTPMFCPSSLPDPMKLPNDTSTTPPNHKNVFVLQTNTLLGRLLMPSTVDHVLLPAGEIARSTKHLNFQNLSRRSVPDFNSSIAQVRAQLGGNMEAILSVIQPLIRVDEPTRSAVLRWMAVAIKNSATRATMGWQHQVAPHGSQLAEHLVSPQASAQLAGSLERFRTFTAMQSVRFNGLLSSGCALNLAWTILELAKPIKVDQSGTIDPMFMVASDEQSLLLHAALAGEARLGDEETLNLIRTTHVHASSPSFKTQIFWLAMNAIHTLILPSCKEAEMAIQVASVFHRDKRDREMNDAYGEFHCFESIFSHPRFVECLAHVINLMLGVVMKAATGGGTVDQLDICQEHAGDDESTKNLSPALAVLPSCMMEEVIELLEFYKLLKDVKGGRGGVDLVDLLDPDLFLGFTIWTLGSDKVKNPNIRGKAAKVLLGLSKEPRFSSRICSDPVCVRNLLPSCIRVFSAVEKTKQSYYDIRMHVKFELRIPIQQLFELLLNHPEHRDTLRRFITGFRAEFYKFASQLLNDTTYLIEEGLDTLISIRKKERDGEMEDEPTGGATSSAGTAGLGVDRTVEQDDQNEAGEDMYRRSRHDPKEHCRQYMRMGHQTMNTLHQMCRQTCDVLVDDKVVLDQMIASCLDPSLDRLVGPKCLELKSEKSRFDFALFEFDPKKLLFQIIEMYCYLAAENSAPRIARTITEDGRYYRPETFRKAVNIARREHLVTPETLRQFESLVKLSNELATQAKNAMDSVEIPDEFLDPIMAEIMIDPVLLPTSHNIMDRRHIMRIIMADDHDPFNRQPLGPADLVPQVELREKIHEFCKTHNIPLDE